MKLRVKDWGEFQHYKERKPPWIKLHRGLLDNYEFHCLPVASRALAPCLWLIASEREDGVIEATFEKLGFRLRQTAKQIEDAINPLIEHGFFVVVQTASNALSESKQIAMPETETETERKTTLSAKNEILKSQAVEVLQFLNEKAGRAYKTVESNIDIIVARLKEGYSVDEMRKVIVRKCNQWKGDEKMDTYLRPETLFNKTKMASYSGELVRPQ